MPIYGDLSELDHPLEQILIYVWRLHTYVPAEHPSANTLHYRTAYVYSTLLIHKKSCFHRHNGIYESRYTGTTRLSNGPGEKTEHGRGLFKMSGRERAEHSRELFRTFEMSGISRR